MKFRKPYTRLTVGQDNHEPSMTKQAMKDESDINRILAKFQRTRLLDYVSQHEPTYQDLPSGFDFETAQNVIQEGMSAFHALPANVRRHFDNDPARFLESIHNGDAEELVALGLATRPEPSPEPAGEAPPVEEPAPAGPAE